MTTRLEVVRVIHGEGPGAARARFGDAIVTDVITNGIGAPVSTGDCAGGPACTCGGHEHVRPTPARPTYDHDALAEIAASLREAVTAAQGPAPAYVAHLGRQHAARQADLRRGVGARQGQTFDHAAAERGRAASERVNTRLAASPLVGVNAKAAAFWASLSGRPASEATPTGDAARTPARTPAEMNARAAQVWANQGAGR